MVMLINGLPYLHDMGRGEDTLRYTIWLLNAGLETFCIMWRYGEW